MQTFCGITTDGMYDYLAAIYRLGKNNRGPSNKVTTTLLAEKMHVSTAAASSMLKRLEDSGFVKRSGSEGVTLEQQGHLAAMQLLRRHRLLEVFLMQVMGFTWDQVDVESHRLEHAISNEFVDRMDQLCGYPTHCPHGDPIPSKDGYLPEEKLYALTELGPGQSGILWRIGTDDARILRYLGQPHPNAGAKITLVEMEPFRGPVTIRLQKPLISTASAEDITQTGIQAHTQADSQADELQILGTELAELLYLSKDKAPDEMRSGWLM